MAQESNEGVSYLMALKQANVAAPTKAADDSHTEASHETEFQGNKRRSPRYKCEGSVQIREQGKDVYTWAAFTDISLHGCYVEAQATYPAGTELNLKLEANGIRVETKGNVRVNYPYLGMGIAFIQMSEDNAARLRQMLARILHPSGINGPGIASTLPSPAPLNVLPPITNPQAALQELIDFFESRQMLMREDFVRLLKKSQE
jgi:hypothetical protein